MTDKKEKIKTFDNVFEYQKRENIYELALVSRFQIGWEDTNILEHREKAFIHSRWDYEHNLFVEKEFIPHIKNKELLKLIDGRKPEQVVLNCTLQNDVYIPHVHRGDDVLLYYVNMEWKQEWWGETQFLSEDLNEIIFTSPYVPGRFIWFDGTTPHTIKTQSSVAPKYRFSLSLFFRKNDGV